MYSESVVAERLDLAREELGWMPEYHSAEEVDKFIAHLDDALKLDSNGKSYFSRDLTAAEFRFIENEKYLSACDAAYALTRYYYISDENNNSVRFKFRGAQPIYFAVISEIESRRAAIELLIAKARQQYITTLTQLLVLHRVLNYHYTYGVVASADASKSAEMAEKEFFTYDHLPWWLKPRYSRRVEGVPGLLKFDTMESRLSILHGATAAKSKGAQKVGIARGSTPTVYGLSEVSAFPDPEQQIEAALFRGVHANPKILGVLESTFAGDKGWFPEKYKYAKLHEHDGMSRLRSLFFPWICAREIYPTPTWWRTHKQHMPGDWVPQGKVAEQITKAELFIQSTALFAKHQLHRPSCLNSSRCTCPTGAVWTMPIEQQWFYNVSFKEAEDSGTLSTLLQELPCDDIEAMQSSFDNVFGREVIELAQINREKRFDVYGFAGQAIDDQYEPHPDDIDYSRKRIVFNHRTPKNDVYRWELIPLKYDLFAGATGADTEREAINNKLFVYKHPEAGFHYSIGGDSATGIGRDASVFSVNRLGRPGTPDIQVAEFRSHRVGHVELFAFILPAALYYRGAVSDDVSAWPKLAVEQIASVGDVCHSELRKLGYPLGRMFRMGRYDGKEQKRELNMIGWGTNGWSRPILVGHIVHAVKNGWYQLNSPWTIEECRQFEIHTTDGGKEKMEHSSDSWDDGIFASAISYFIVHDMDSLAERSKKQVLGIESSNGGLLPPLDINPYDGHSYNPNTRQLTLDQVLSADGLDRYRH